MTEHLEVLVSAIEIYNEAVQDTKYINCHNMSYVSEAVLSLLPCLFLDGPQSIHYTQTSTENKHLEPPAGPCIRYRTSWFLWSSVRERDLKSENPRF